MWSYELIWISLLIKYKQIDMRLCWLIHFDWHAVISILLNRWFCEGRELHHCPDIQICRDGDLHTLVITEAFEDDTGRYTCVASNALGADNTSAEVYIEGELQLHSNKKP